MKECEWCGRSFGKHPKESRKQWQARRFCCRKCARRWRAEFAPSRRAAGSCDACGATVEQLLDALCKSCWDRRRYWRQPHLQARARQWQREHPERTREILRAALCRRRARINGARLGDRVVTDEYAEVLRSDPCAYCGAAASNIDHIEAISRGGAHAWDNLTAACRTCNLSKYSEPLLTFLLRRVGQRPQTGQDEAPVRE